MSASGESSTMMHRLLHASGSHPISSSDDPKSSLSLQQLHGATKPSGDRTGLGYNSDESSTAETSSTPMLERIKFKTMNFVKSSTGQPKEAPSDNGMIVAKSPIRLGRCCGLGYSSPEKSFGEMVKQKNNIEVRLTQIWWYNTRPVLSNFRKDRQYRPQYRRFRSNGPCATSQDPSRSKNTHGAHKTLMHTPVEFESVLTMEYIGMTMGEIGQDSVFVLMCMVKNPKKKFQGYTVQVSTPLASLVKADLRASVKLHPQKVLTSKSVQTYIKKNLEVKPASESIKHTEDTASDTDAGEYQVAQPVEKEKDDPSVHIADTVNNPGLDPTSEDNNADHQGPNRSHIQMDAFTTDSEEDTRLSFLDNSESSHTGSQQMIISSPPPPDSPQANSKIEEVYKVVASIDSRIIYMEPKLTSVDSMTLSIDSKMHSMESKLRSMNSNIEQLMDTQTFLKLDFGRYKHIIYDKVDNVRPGNCIKN
ncbi:hypothetical protein F511_39301 [Dorcoceras hygrometricum]|uniref:Uncharacterized protein n=1 Tax=Dorcoceras hygrometricum TaxID=472368 RepID=A0A2Z7C6S2_9LAMI|nr:hypothetical protein F511_39301 [Dorcoceras hygrometricum]